MCENAARSGVNAGANSTQGTAMFLESVAKFIKRNILFLDGIVLLTRFVTLSVNVIVLSAE